MEDLCTKCPNSFDHKEHQRCYNCGQKVPVPLNLMMFSNSTLCSKCFNEKYKVDENGNLISIIKV